MAKDINESMANVKDLNATPDDVAIAAERAARRLVMLARELMAEMDDARGAQSAVAAKLGVNQGMLSKLLSKERDRVGMKYVENARKACNLKHEYFFGVREPRSYHDYIGGEMDAPYQAWSDFVSTEIGKSMTGHERVTLASIRFSNREPSVALYQVFLLDLRGHGEPSKSARRVDINERLDSENDEDDDLR